MGLVGLSRVWVVFLGKKCMFLDKIVCFCIC